MTKVESVDDPSANFLFGNIQLALQNQQTVGTDGQEFADAIDMRTSTLANFWRVGLVKKLFAGCELFVELLKAVYARAVGWQRQFGGRPETMVDGIVGERLKAPIAVGCSKRLRHREPSARALPVESVFEYLLVAVAADVDSLVFGNKGYALGIAVGNVIPCGWKVLTLKIQTMCIGNASADRVDVDGK